jgi:hypothetical protein
MATKAIPVVKSAPNEIPAKSTKRTVKGKPGKVNRIAASAGIVPSIAATGTLAATAGNKIKGYEGQVYYSVPAQNGLAAVPSALFANVVSFDLDVKGDTIDWSDRATLQWKDKTTGRLEWSGTVKANAVQNGVETIAFYAAITGSLNLTGEFRPQDVTGGIAWTGTFVITGYKFSSADSGSETIDLTIEGRGALILGQVTAGGVA